MLGSTILESAIGMVLIFLLMSLICSALREVIESVMKHRASDLHRGIRELLQDREGTGLVRELYSHPLVYGLFEGEYDAATKPKRLKSWFGSLFRPMRTLPSYIPSSSFARALIDLEQQGRVRSPEIVAVLRSLAQETGEDIAALRANVETWFDSSADRMGGWYKRRTQLILFMLGYAAAVSMNINPIVIGSSLFQEADLRAAAVATAESFVAADSATRTSYQTNVQELHSLAAAGMPIGNHIKAVEASWFTMLLGWLITGLAVTLGAPFWFDLLSKFMQVRSTIKPKQTKSASDAQPALAVAPAAPAVARDGQVARVASINRAAVPLPLIPAGYQPNTWKDAAEPEEGVL
jgi:hypothetical protein